MILSIFLSYRRPCKISNVSHSYFDLIFCLIVPVAVASVFACLVALFCILVYIPSYVNTVLKLRCGKMPSLRDPYIRIIRTMGDGVVTNVGKLSLCLFHYRRADD